MRTRHLLTLCCVFLLSIGSRNGLIAQNAPRVSPDNDATSARKVAASTANDAASNASQSDPRIGPGDLLELKVFGAPELQFFCRRIPGSLWRKTSSCSPETR